jgi:hypothetical protein
MQANKKLKTIRRFHNLSCPSGALEAMLQGMLEQDERPDFVIEMRTFGDATASMAANRACFGCAATCAAQHAAGVDLTPETITSPRRRTPGIVFTSAGDRTRARALRVTRTLLRQFEVAMEFARKGDMNHLFQFFYGVKSTEPSQYFDARIYLTDDDWREQIPAIRCLIIDLKAAGY